MAKIVDLNQPASGAKFRFAVMLLHVLECREHMPIRQPKKGVRMLESGQIRKRSHDCRTQRIFYVENKGTTRGMVVREYVTRLRHRVFGMMNLHGLLVGHDG